MIPIFLESLIYLSSMTIFHWFSIILSTYLFRIDPLLFMLIGFKFCYLFLIRLVLFWMLYVLVHFTRFQAVGFPPINASIDDPNIFHPQPSNVFCKSFLYFFLIQIRRRERFLISHFSSLFVHFSRVPPQF